MSDPQQEERPGVAIDSRGGTVIDPTKNVLDLVRAGQDFQNAMREELAKRIDERHAGLKELVRLLADSITTFQNSQMGAETRRIDQLALTRQDFQNTIKDMLAESVRTTSTLVSDQLKQIQATFDGRVTKLEAGAFTEAGKKSVADPATSDAIARMASLLASNKTNADEAMARMAANNIEQTAKLTAAITAVGSKEQAHTSSRMGQGQVIAWIIGAAMLMAAIATPLIAFLALRAH